MQHILDFPRTRRERRVRNHWHWHWQEAAVFYPTLAGRTPAGSGPVTR